MTERSRGQGARKLRMNLSRVLWTWKRETSLSIGNGRLSVKEDGHLRCGQLISGPPLSGPDPVRNSLPSGNRLPGMFTSRLPEFHV